VSQDWPALLDRIADWTLAERHALAVGGDPSAGVPAAPSPAAGLGPLPDEHADRARTVLAGQAELSAELQQAQDDTRRELHAHRRSAAGARTGASREPVYVDGRG
jgi:hypothetical protein